MKLLIVFPVLIFLSLGLFGQVENSIIREGNRLFNEGEYKKAEVKFLEALEFNPENIYALYNLGNTLYKQGRYEEAAEVFEAVSQISSENELKSQAFHNLGNSHIGLQNYDKSIEAYKESLRLNPGDMDSRYNLIYAMNRLQEQDEQQCQDEQDQEEGDDQDDEQEQEQKPDTQNDKNDDEQQEQQRPDQISPQDAERILEALRQEEQKVLEEMEEKKKETVPGRVDKEW